MDKYTVVLRQLMTSHAETGNANKITSAASKPLETKLSCSSIQMCIHGLIGLTVNKQFQLSTY